MVIQRRLHLDLLAFRVVVDFVTEIASVLFV